LVLAQGVSAVTKGLPPERAEVLLAPAAQALTAALAKATDPTDRWVLAEGLSAAARRLPPDRRARQLIDCSGRFLDVSFVLSPAIGELASGASLERAVEWLKHPLCYGHAAAAILSQIKTSDGKTFRTRWELVEWLRRNRPDIDLSAPPKLD
jgi:hypothetical protein